MPVLYLPHGTPLHNWCTACWCHFCTYPTVHHCTQLVHSLLVPVLYLPHGAPLHNWWIACWCQFCTYPTVHHCTPGAQLAGASSVLTPWCTIAQLVHSLLVPLLYLPHGAPLHNWWIACWCQFCTYPTVHHCTPGAQLAGASSVLTPWCTIAQLVHSLLVPLLYLPHGAPLHNWCTACWCQFCTYPMVHHCTTGG